MKNIMKIEELEINQKAEIVRLIAKEIKSKDKNISMYHSYLRACKEVENMESIDLEKYNITIK